MKLTKIFIAAFCVVFFGAFSTLNAANLGENQDLAKNPEILQFSSGENKIAIINLLNGQMPLKNIVANEAQKKIISQVYPNGIKNKHLVILVKNPNFIALIDNGYENTTNTLKAALDSLGVSFNDITHLVISHAHPDHIGAMINGKFFPKAQVLIDKIEADFWLGQKDENPLKAALNNYKNISYFDYEKPLISANSGIRLIREYGHTPGMAGFVFFAEPKIAQNAGNNAAEILNKGADFIFVADLFHAYKAQLKDNKIALIFDSDKNTAISVRAELVKLFKQYKTPIVGTHVGFIEPIVLE